MYLSVATQKNISGAAIIFENYFFGPIIHLPAQSLPSKTAAGILL